jgi:hypothetical protein
MLYEGPGAAFVSRPFFNVQKIDLLYFFGLADRFHTRPVTFNHKPGNIVRTEML